VDRSSEDRAYQYPEKTRQEPELGRKDRAYKGACARDRREMMAEEKEFIRRVVIFIIAVGMGGRRTGRVEDEHLRDYEFSVETVREREYEQAYYYKS